MNTIGMAALRMSWSASLCAARREPLHITNRGDHVGVMLTACPGSIAARGDHRWPALVIHDGWVTIGVNDARRRYSELIAAVASGSIPGVLIVMAKHNSEPWVAIVPAVHDTIQT